MRQRTILVVEDEETLARALAYTLEGQGYRVITAADGVDGLSKARSSVPDLVLLDLLLPRMDGVEVCRALRRESSVPVLMLTAKTEESDKIVGLGVGADDYVTKPFSMGELLARVGALLRRAEMAPSVPAEGPPVLRADGLELDVLSRELRRDGHAVPLRPKEFDLLSFLMGNPGIVFSRSTLLERVWGYEYAGDTRTVDVHVRWLREKIEDDPSNPQRLLTARGAGYKFGARDAA